MSDEQLNAERAAVAVRDVRRYFLRGSESVRALDGVSLDVLCGELVCLRGPSGSGKSTLLNVIGCLDEVSGGSVSVLGVETTRLSPLDAGRFRRDHIGFVFEELSLVPYLTALENVMLPLVMDQSAVARSRDQAEKELYRVELGSRLDHFPRELSSGERQRVAIARALVRIPRILLADEPSASLDSLNVDRIAALFRDLASGGRSVIIATHDDRLARQADRTIWLCDGLIASPGSQ